MKIFIRATCVLSAVLAFLWILDRSHGDVFKALKVGLSPVVVMLVLEKWHKSNEARKASGLSDLQFMLKEAGSAEKLKRNASSLYRIALVISVFSYLIIFLSLISLRGQSLHSTSPYIFIVGSIFLLLIARAFFQESRKMKRAADVEI
ncbi:MULTISPECIES: hypothetical protein [Methylomonas]|uniref:DUF2178 domain-containing protein n=1 Tax=Methylomonas methanica TaxID=421 RepID=A0ABY2CKR0_METMH|nr:MULTISPECIES: hypothetical protein [Methylomonas]TCV82799.1 hypothetical protein EDE11_11154 [Methylomonas methanica]